MRSRRTDMGDCDVDTGEFYLKVREGIIIDCSGTSGTVLELLAEMADVDKRNTKRDNQEKTDRFIGLLKEQGVTIGDILQAAKKDVGNVDYEVRWKLFPGGTYYCRIVDIRKAYKIRANVSRRIKEIVFRDIVSAVRPTTYGRAYQKYSSETDRHILEMIDRCEDFSEFKSGLRGLCAWMTDMYMRNNMERLIKEEGKALRRLMRREKRSCMRQIDETPLKKAARSPRIPNVRVRV